MGAYLWLIPFFPFAGFLILALFGKRLPRKLSALVGCGSVAASAVTVCCMAASFLGSTPAGGAVSQKLWSWLSVTGFNPEIALRLDSLSLTMCLVVTVVGFLIHLFSSEFMAEDDAYSRFFAYMNLFVGSMLTLVLADNLLLLYLGWEGVGLCSFLLIGFWYKEPANAAAARKAFLVTRVGDAAMALGLFLLWRDLGTLNIAQLLAKAPVVWHTGDGAAIAAAALLLGGAVGKSAQLPLQTWLPDAMAGPTPVSALIHAATMVTAGVYLIARTHTIFELAPTVQTIVAVVGAATLLLSGCSALVQSDLKRSLAYSTISQIGYMFLALGVGAWSGAIFHLASHACFKALLFLGAGAIIHCCHHEHSMFRMGGLRKELPVTFWTFLIGASALAGFPLVTAGFYSKDHILAETFAAQNGGTILWIFGTIGAFLTALYSYRMVFLVFYGEKKTEAERKPGMAMRLPLIVLAVFSLTVGFFQTPGPLGHVEAFGHFLQKTLPAPVGELSGGTEVILLVIASLVALAGLFVAWVFYVRKPKLAFAVRQTPAGAALSRFWISGWGFDRLYEFLFVNPYVWLAHFDKDDVLDAVAKIPAALGRAGYLLFSRTQTGRLRFYVSVLAAGAVFVLAVVAFS